MQPIGYKIALELMVRGRLRVKELPIDFRDRSMGSSKMNWRQQLNFLRHLYRLYRVQVCRDSRGTTGEWVIMRFTRT